MVSGEAAAAREPGGPQGPADATWLVLQRLDDLRRAQDDARGEMRDMRGELRDMRGELRDMRKDLEAKIDSVRNWSLGLLLLAILGLLAKLLIPGS